MQVTEAAAEFQDSWDTFVQASPGGSFLQSWAWGEFQRAAGFPVIRLVVRRRANAAVHAVCLCVRRPLPLRRFSLYAPWGPVLEGGLSSADAEAVFSVLADTCRTRLAGGGVFARVEPKLPAENVAPVLTRTGFLRPERSVQPKDTRVLELSQSEDDLLRAMHPKTRYNIRLARRHEVVVTEQTHPNGLQRFLGLAREVMRRERFQYHPDPYYVAMLNTLGPAGLLTLLVAEVRHTPLAANLLVRFGDTVTYVHGASSSQRKHVMAPYLLQWEGILRAKAGGARRYDLFGVAPPGSSATHPWFGITRFKQGFGGAEEHTVGAADLVTDAAVYRAIEIGRSLRTLLR